MAIDPKEQVGTDIVYEPGYPEKTQLPNGIEIPDGVKTDGTFYAIRKNFRDGTSTVTWYQRDTAPKGSDGKPLKGPDGKAADPEVTTTAGPFAALTKQQYDADVAKEAAAARATTGDTTVQGQQSRVQVNPATGQPEYATVFPATAANPTPQISYRPATAAELTQAGYTPRTEGTPLPGGGFDNEQPRVVVRGPDGTIVGQPRALTDDERKAWNISRQRSRNPNGLSDEEVRAQQTQTGRGPVDGHPGYSVIKTVNPQTGQTETHYEKDDAPGVAVQLPPSAPQSRTNPTNNHFEELDPATGQWVDRGLIQSKPVIRPNPVTGTDEQVQEVPDGQGGVKLIVRPIERQGGDASTPSDAPNVDLSDPQKAYDSFMKLYQWASSKVARGEQTPTWLENVLKGPHEAVTTVLDREKEMTRRAENTQGNQLTQRSQDISFADNRLSNATQGLQTATSAADKINSLAGPGLHAYSSTLLGTLALQGLQNQALGGTNALPASVVPGPVAGQPGAAMPGLPAGAVPDAAAAQAEADRQRSMAAQADVSGQGAVVGPVTAGATATNAAANDPSGANLQAATDATMAGSAGLFNPQPPAGLAPTVAPQSSLLPNVGTSAPGPAPLLAMLGSRLGGDPLAAAKDALRRMGIGEDSILAAHQDFLAGGA